MQPTSTVKRSLSSLLFPSPLPVFTTEAFTKAKAAFLADFEKKYGAKLSPDSLSKIANLKKIIDTVELKPTEIVASPASKVTIKTEVPNKAFLIEKIKANKNNPTYSALSEKKGEVVERYSFAAMLGYKNYREIDATLQVFVGEPAELAKIGSELMDAVTALEKTATTEFPAHADLLTAYFHILRQVVEQTGIDEATRKTNIRAKVEKLFQNAKPSEIDAHIASALELFAVLNKKYLGLLNLNQAIVWKGDKQKVTADALEKQVTAFLARPDANMTLSTVEAKDVKTNETLFRFWQLQAHHYVDVVAPVVVAAAPAPVVTPAPTPKTAPVTVVASSAPAPKPTTPKSQKAEVKETKPAKV